MTGFKAAMFKFCFLRNFFFFSLSKTSNILMFVSSTFLLQLCINGTNDMHEDLQHKVKIIL